MLESLASSMGLGGVLIICLIAMLILYGAAELVKWVGSRNRQEDLSARPEKQKVTVTGKRMHGRTYYTTFQFEDGIRMEMELSGEAYGMLAEGDTGELTRTGETFVSFERDMF